MVDTSAWVSCDDGAKLFLRRWKPAEDTKPAGIIYIVHGMAEHSLRYRRLAEKLCSGNIEVWSADMRGHGKTADLSQNDRRKGGLLGHTTDKGGYSRIVADIQTVTSYIEETTKNEYGKLDFFIMGHSWGSFLVQAYIQNPSVPLSGCILSGSRGPGGLKIGAGAAVLSLVALFKGSRRYSKLAQALSTGSYNNPFKPNRTPFDWLSRDEKEVDQYIADPLCGQRCSSGFYRDMIRLLKAVHRKKALARINKELPIYIVCGNADPVGDMGVSPTALVNAYQNHGIHNLKFVKYPEARHEPINETNREEVSKDLIGWLLQQIT